jgi:hypothetical protein
MAATREKSYDYKHQPGANGVNDMGFQEFMKKLLGSSQMPQLPSVQRLQPVEEIYGNYSVRGQAIEQVYLAWSRDKIIPAEQVRALTPDAFVANLDNRSGYVREFCLRALAVHAWAQALKPVAQRLNDYVPINRELALQLVLKWLAELPIATVVDALPELTALAQQSRTNVAAVHEAVLRSLRSEAGQSALVAGTSHTHAKVRRVCWKLCLETLSWSGPQRIDAAMRCGDPAIARSVESDVFALPDDALLAWLARIHQLRAMPLRRAILVALRRRGLVDGHSLVACALWDHSFSIRWLARFWSKDAADFLVQQYLDVLDAPSDPRRKRYALEGLEALKAPGTLAVCKQAMADDNLAIRKAALMAACSIDAEHQTEHIAIALQDADLAVVRQAFRMLAASGEPLPLDALQTLANTRCNELPFFVLMLQCASQMSLWPAMHLASFTSLATSTLKPQLQEHVDHFLSGLALAEVYVAPTPKQWQAICSWLPIHTLAPNSSLRYVMEIYAKRMGGVITQPCCNRSSAK